MKFECPSCGKKYSLPDEKVPAGKDFKVKCKKCNEVIVLRGGQGEDAGSEAAAAAPVLPPVEEGFGPEEQPTRVFDYSRMAADGSPLPDPAAGYGSAHANAFQPAAPVAAAAAPAKKAPAASDGIEWFVAVDGDQMGPYETAQMKEMLSAGQITRDTFVWRDGFDDWLPVNGVPIFSAKTAEAKAPATPKAASPGSPFSIGGGASRGQDLFATAGSEAADSPFGGGGGGAVVSSAGAAPAAIQSPRVDAAQLKGARHDNSVLFSLSSLQALASSSRDPSPGTRGAPGAATGAGGSGLIDIRSLTAGASSPRPAGGSSTDDILSIGGPGIGSPIGVPSLLQPVKKEPSKLPYILGGVGGLVVIALTVVLVVVLIGGKKEAPGVDEEALRKQILAELMKSNPQLSAEEAEQQAKAKAAAQLSSGQDSVTTPGNATEGAAATDTGADDAKKGGKKGPGKKKAGEEGSDEGSEASSPGSEKPETGSKTPSSAEASLMDLIGKAAKKPEKEPAKETVPSKGSAKEPAKTPEKVPVATSGLPEKPTKQDVMDALKSVTPAVNSCGKGQTGVATVSITIAGATGSVASAKVVSGPFAGTPAAGCIEGAVKKAKFPKFSQTKFSVSYPFVIK